MNSTFYNLSRIEVQPPPSFICCPRPPSHHPSSITSVSIVPALHLLPLSIPFWPYDNHPFFPHAKTISILTGLLYSLTPFLFQLSYAPLHSKLCPFVKLQPNFSNTLSQEHLLSFFQHFSYPMPLLRPTPLVQLLIHIDLYPQPSIAQDTFQCSSRSIPLIHSVYHIHFIIHRILFISLSISATDSRIYFTK